MADILIEKVAKSFGAAKALHEIDMTVADGEFVALLGPSGCGKTTLLRIIAGLETQSGGRIVIGGRDLTGLPPRLRGLAMVFQNYAIFPHMTVAENIAFGLRMQGADTARVGKQVSRAAKLLHIEQYLERYPAKLSGGQRQRVAVARALAVEPAVLLMDEPLSNLDALLRLEMRTELRAVLREAGTTTLYVTHDQTEAMGLADRIAVMYGGKIEQIAPPNTVYTYPATRFVGGFIGNPPMNFIKAKVSGGQALIGGATIPAPVTEGDIELGLRGEDATLSSATNAVPFDVRVVEPMGSHLLLTGSIDGQLARIVAPPTASVHSG
ncbi:MAG: ABC transporter ATP-binding protein, partial [Bosea sp. (in: a-proteobacteria)]